ncbi:MAG: inositol monophosphatase family protein [Acidimicrobiales bacterium]
MWLIDPIDGTGNYVNGSDAFGVMVALVVDGVAQASWIWLPVAELMYTAVRGQGAFRNNTPIDDASSTKAPSQMSGTIKRRYLPPDMNAKVSATAAGFGAVGVGQYCAAVEYAALAERDGDFILYGRVLPWDHVPGALLVAETGGAVRWLDGSDYTHKHDGFGILAVADEANWSAVSGVMFGR